MLDAAALRRDVRDHTLRLAPLVVLVLTGHSCTLQGTRQPIVTLQQGSGASVEQIAFLDEYLEHWDNFAQGYEDTTYINGHLQEFYDTLVGALESGEPRAVPRAVFYFFVQLYFFLPENSTLYDALHEISEGELRAREIQGDWFLDSSQVWSWWREHSEEYPEYRLLEEWLSRPLAQEEVIPLYEQLEGAP